MGIYTKKGDKGNTGLYSGKNRLTKDSLRIRAVGAVDGAKSYLGVIVSESEDVNLIIRLEEIQEDMIVMWSMIVGSNLRF